MLFLLAAKDIYNMLDASGAYSIEAAKRKKKGIVTPQANGEGEQKQRDGTFGRQLDAHYTHTLFYLAQVRYIQHVCMHLEWTA